MYFGTSYGYDWDYATILKVGQIGSDFDLIFDFDFRTAQVKDLKRRLKEIIEDPQCTLDKLEVPSPHSAPYILRSDISIYIIFIYIIIYWNE